LVRRRNQHPLRLGGDPGEDRRMSDELPPHFIQSALQWREEQAKARARAAPKEEARAKARTATMEKIAEELQRNPMTVSLLASDTSARRTMLMRPMPGLDRMDESRFEPRPLEDTDIT